MSRFLQRLASRALGAVPVATPRLAPLFNAGTDVDVDTGLALDDTRETPVRVASPRVARESEPVATKNGDAPVFGTRAAIAAVPRTPIETEGAIADSREDRATSPRRDAIAAIASSSPTTASGADPLEPATRPTEAPRPRDALDRRDPPRPPATIDAVRRDPAPQGKAAIGAASPPPLRPEAPMANRVVDALRPSAVAPPTEHERPDAEPVHHVAREPTRRPIESGARAASLPIANSTERLRGPAAPTRSGPPLLPAQAAAAAPTINVTIGRVEVRATTASPAASGPRRPAAVPTRLEQYLNRRNGSGA